MKDFLSGGSYEGIPLEQNAYELDGRFAEAPASAFSVAENRAGTAVVLPRDPQTKSRPASLIYWAILWRSKQCRVRLGSRSLDREA